VRRPARIATTCSSRTGTGRWRRTRGPSSPTRCSYRSSSAGCGRSAPPRRPSPWAEILTRRHGHHLDAWIVTLDADGQPDPHSFNAGLRRDHDAVRNGLTLPYSSGAVEGHVNRIKMIKRPMYSRANLDPLRNASYSPEQVDHKLGNNLFRRA